MIFFRVAVQWPFKSGNWRDIWQREFWISKNKALELGVDYYLHDLFELAVDLYLPSGDHDGPSIELRLLGLGFRIGIRDRRHWDYEAYMWEQN
jgi:hypothetical protein